MFFGSHASSCVRRYAARAVVVTALLATAVPSGSVAGAAGPKITVTPSTQLRSGQTVTVAGSGFFAGEDLIALECPRGAVTDPLACDFSNYVEVVTSAQGRFSTKVAVHRTIATETGFTDCAPSACELVFADSSGFTNQATATLKFDASIALPKTSVSVTPSTGLGDRATVTIAGKGFTGDRQVTAVECLAASFSCVGGFGARADTQGNFSVVGSARRYVFDIDGNPVDCAGAAGTCEMLALDPANADYHSAAPLAFDPTLPPPPPPTLKVTPADNLPYYARVSARGKHWAAGDLVALMECPDATDPLSCFNFIGIAQVGSDGTLSADLMLTRELADPFGGKPTDCAKRNRCGLVVQDFSDETPVTVPVTFDPTAPIPPKPKVVVSPAGPYADHQTVTVKGRNFAPNALFESTECFTSTNVFGCFLVKGPARFTDAHGDFSTQVTLRRFIKAGGTIDCAAASVQCSLTSASEGGVQIDTPLSFSTTAARSAIDAATATTFGRAGGLAARAAAPCSGLRLPTRFARALAAHPRERAKVCAMWRRIL